jgi:hypothetical protein
MARNERLVVERVQTGVRMEKRLLKVLKGFAELHDMSLGDLLEGIVLHAFDGKCPFGEASRKKIKDKPVEKRSVAHEPDDEILADRLAMDAGNCGVDTVVPVRIWLYGPARGWRTRNATIDSPSARRQRNRRRASVPGAGDERRGRVSIAGGFLLCGGDSRSARSI